MRDDLLKIQGSRGFTRRFLRDLIEVSKERVIDRGRSKIHMTRKEISHS